MTLYNGKYLILVGFFQLKDYYGPMNSGIPLIILIFAGFMFIGFVFSFFLPETKQKSLEDINKEYERNERLINDNDINIGKISVISNDLYDL